MANYSNDLSLQVRVNVGNYYDYNMYASHMRISTRMSRVEDIEDTVCNFLPISLALLARLYLAHICCVKICLQQTMLVHAAELIML